ncbi:hypothetical protein TcCL_Unassigned02414 [Trypanosoma cruzi]|nr:hypothetical protein TcCL_Unassigned02414 [Trypanosoma cruzi]
MPVRSASLLRADGWMVPSGGKLTPPQFIGAGVFMCRHIRREGNGGPFLLPCTADSTVATCVHRMGHMTHSTQLTIPAVHAHIKATESVILMLSLSTGSGTIRPRPHTHAIAQAAVTRSTRHIHRHNHRIRITRYISSTPSSRHAHGRAAAARERKDQHGAHRTITGSGVAGASQLIREPEGKGMEQEGEERSIADAARESRQHEERAAGPAAQFTPRDSIHARKANNASSHPPCRRRRHPPPSSPAHSCSPKEMATARTHHTSHTRCITPAGKETRAAHTLSSLLLMATKEDNSRHAQPPAHATKEAFKSTAMCILCVWVCLQKHRAKN